MDQNGAGVGQTLRRYRERRQLSLETIARATMIRRDYLELIDADQLDRLPAGAYAKGFIRAYANYLGMDPAPLVKGYEERCGHPAPELSSVVRHPVRVPNAVQPRTWRMAAGVGVVLMLMLALLGIVRPGDETAEAPVPSTDEIAALAAGQVPGDTAKEAAEALGAIVKVEVIGESAWVEAHPDGRNEFAGTLVRGERKLFRGQDAVHIVLGNARAVKLYVNGRELGTPPGGTYRATLTPQTTVLPSYAPAPAP